MANSTQWLTRYVDSRERVLGGRWLHRDAGIAAEQVAEKEGGVDAAIQWALDLLAELEARQ